MLLKHKEWSLTSHTLQHVLGPLTENTNVLIEHELKKRKFYYVDIFYCNFAMLCEIDQKCALSSDSIISLLGFNEICAVYPEIAPSSRLTVRYPK